MYQIVEVQCIEIDQEGIEQIAVKWGNKKRIIRGAKTLPRKITRVDKKQQNSPKKKVVRYVFWLFQCFNCFYSNIIRIWFIDKSSLRKAVFYW